MIPTRITVSPDDGSKRVMQRLVDLHTALKAGDYYFFGGKHNPSCVMVASSGEGPDKRSPVQITLGKIPTALFEALLQTTAREPTGWKEV